LIRHRLIQSRKVRRSPAFTRRSYAVLAQVSLRCPPRLGRFRCIPHPSATRHQGVLLHLMLPFDLHVLGMPPAFNLSQDQTLHLKVSTIWRSSVSLKVRTQPAFIAELQRLKVWTSCIDDFQPSARRPHKSPAHTVKERLFASRRFAAAAQHLIGRADHFTTLSVSVNSAKCANSRPAFRRRTSR